jgi:SAM-dependent methyltransferase
MTTTQAEPEAIEAMAGRLFSDALGAFHMGSVYLGVKLGLFRALCQAGAATAADLAAATGLDPWYVREWLQAEATSGLVSTDGDDLGTARFSLAPGVQETLVEETHPAYVGGLPLAVAAVGGVLPALLDAVHTGAGVPYSAYGADAVEAQAALNRPAFVNSLVAEWLPQIPGALQRLSDTSRPARVADVGCGVGWAAIELARAFPHVVVDGFDADEESVSQARRRAAERGVSDRVTFEVVDAASGGGYGERRYDLVLFFECVHDMAHPTQALAAARRAVTDEGTVVVMDERVGDTLRPGDPTETFFATASVLWCLPQSRVDPDSEAPGTVMRPATFTAIARRAGWAGVDVLPIEHPFWRFYRLVR